MLSKEARQITEYLIDSNVFFSTNLPEQMRQELDLEQGVNLHFDPCARSTASRYRGSIYVTILVTSGEKCMHLK